MQYFNEKKQKNLHFVLLSEQKEGGKDCEVNPWTTHRGTEAVAVGPDEWGWKAEKCWG